MVDAPAIGCEMNQFQIPGTKLSDRQSPPYSYSIWIAYDVAARDGFLQGGRNRIPPAQ
jgi:hypothetical protein